MQVQLLRRKRQCLHGTEVSACKYYYLSDSMDPALLAFRIRILCWDPVVVLDGVHPKSIGRRRCVRSPLQICRNVQSLV